LRSRVTLALAEENILASKLRRYGGGGGARCRSVLVCTCDPRANETCFSSSYRCPRIAFWIYRAGRNHSPLTCLALSKTTFTSMLPFSNSHLT
jgi:hypothetical protein